MADERTICRSCCALEFGMIPINGEWSCCDCLSKSDAMDEIVRVHERLSAAEAESGRICQQRDDAEKERHDALERLAAANDLIAHLRISEAGYIDEYRKAKDKLAAAEADCNEFAAKILALRQEVFDAKRRLAAAEAFAAKHKCKTCGGILVSISELCSCDDDEAAKAGGGE